MCGLIAWVSRSDADIAPDLLLDQYERQWGRGTRGFGLIEVNKDGVRIRRATEPVKALLDVARSTAPTLLFHHRFPTSTDNDMEQTHPIFVSHAELAYDYHFMHNGVIRNPGECRKEHEGLGYAYRTTTPVSGYRNGSTYQEFNDSEAFAIEMARFIEKKSGGLKAYGAAAFLGLALDKKTKKPVTIFFGTNGDNPLRFVEGTGLLIASELPEDTSVPCMPNMLYQISCKNLFGQKSKSILGDTSTGPLTYLPEPEVVRTLLLSPKTNNIGFKPSKKGTSASIDFELEDTLPVREEAVQKRLDRFMENLVDDVLIPSFAPFFDHAAYEDMGEDDVDELLMSIRDELIDQLPLLSNIREHFDEEDEADYQGIVADQRRNRDEKTDNASLNYDGFKHISSFIPF